MATPWGIKAVRLYAKQRLSIDELPLTPRQLQEGFVRIRPIWCGICQGDVSQYLKGPIMMPTKQATHERSHESLPLILGHEFSAVVIEAHPDVSGVQLRDRVAVEPVIGDGTCYMCLAGRENNCVALSIMDLSQSGSIVGSLVVPAQKCHKLPDSISFELGALVEPLDVAWNGVLQSTTKGNTSALVLGSGPIGIATCLSLRALGWTNIAICGRSALRNAFVKQYKIAQLLPYDEQNMVESVLNCFESTGPHCVFDTANTQSTIDLALSVLRRGGIYHTFGEFHAFVTIDMNTVVLKSIQITGDACYAKGIFEAVIAAIADGSIDSDTLHAMISARIGLDEVETRGILESINHKERYQKILVKVNDE